MVAILVRLLGPARAGLLMEFTRFGTVGFLGFVVDNSLVYGLRGAMGLYWAGALAYVVAATTTWGFNRLWTYRGRSRGAVHRQWALSLTVSTLGFTVNRGIYFAVITLSALAAEHPIMATFAGTLGGMFLNFHFARAVVFRRPPAITLTASSGFRER